MPDHPLAEVFGFPVDNDSPRAQRYRQHRLCPFNNRVANCTKDKANDPLGVCTIFAGENDLAITCPVRFRQDWLITEDAAAFCFPPGTRWTTLTEVRLNDRNGKSAGNIDVVLVAYDDAGRLIDFGTLEVQAVYISGNVRRPFEAYMRDPAAGAALDWSAERHYPRPDYLSSSRKRLVPQLMYKGGILRAWGKRQAVALHHGFFDTLPVLPEVAPETADLVWLVYDLQYDVQAREYRLVLSQRVYTMFSAALDQIATPDPGPVTDFIDLLQERLDSVLDDDSNPPDAPTLSDMFGMS